MTIDDFITNRWADAKEVLRKLDPDFVVRLGTRLRMDRIKLSLPSDMYAQSEKPPRKRLPKRWHDLLEACFELTMITRNYQTSTSNMTSEAVSGMNDDEAGKLFVYSHYTWVFYQDAVLEHIKTVISLVSRIYGVREGTANQLKECYHKKADALKKRTEKGRHAIAHGGGFISRGLTEDQWWENSVAIGLLPGYLLDESVYVERGKRLHSGYYDELIKTGSQAFLDDVARILHEFEQEIIAPG